MSTFIRRQVPKAVAVALILATYAFSRLPAPTAAEREGVAHRFRFERKTIGDPAAGPRSIRAVHPSLSRIDAWISSVGAGVALNDLDGDGEPNDACLVDPRTDRVLILPVTLPDRYEPFALAMPAAMVDPSVMAPMGCTPGDLNEDGRTDLLVHFWGRTPLMFLRREGRHAADAYVARTLLDRDERWYTNALTRADLDGDGHADIVVANYFPDGAAILDAHGSGVEPMPTSMSRARNGGAKHVLLWAGSREGQPREVSFRRVDGALPPEAAGSWTLALGAADLDADLRPELYFANDFGPDLLLHNDSAPGQLRFTPLQGRRRLTTPGSKIVGRDSFKGMGIDFADMNGDGRQDMFVSNIADEYALLESHLLFMSEGDPEDMRRGVAPYVDRSEALGLSRSGWAWDAKLDDFDNDGHLEALQATGFVRGTASRWPELHELATGNDGLLANPRHWPRFGAGADLSGSNRNPFFARFADGRYYDVSEDLGFDRSISRGIAIADVDLDGRLDMCVANQWQASSCFANRSPKTGAYLGLRLMRPITPNQSFELRAGRPPLADVATPAIGAVARVRLPDGRSLVREVDAGNGHSGKRSTELHFGLGKISMHKPLDVEVSWRDENGRKQTRPLRVTAGWYTVILGEWAD